VADLTTRAFRPDHAAALTELFNTVEVAAGGHAGYTTDETGTLVEALVRDPSVDSRLLVTSSGTLAAGGLALTPPAGGFRVDLLGGVHPDWRGRGSGGTCSTGSSRGPSVSSTTG
jgi:hypothetical protein